MLCFFLNKKLSKFGFQMLARFFGPLSLSRPNFLNISGMDEISCLSDNFVHPSKSGNFIFLDFILSL
jgi:hypothetical protein